MSNDLMIPDKSSVPSFLVDAVAAAQNYADASAGISGGFPAKVKLSGKQFTLVDEGGEEKPYPPAALVADAEGNVYLPAIMLAAKGPLSKGWYLEKYNPNAPKSERKAPDCFSLDGLKPAAASTAPQCETCAACPHNQYGSGTDQNGAPTDGKACNDKKVLAIYIPKYGIYKFEIPGGSLKNWRKFTDQVKFNLPDVPFYSFKTLIGFDLSTTKSILVFRFGGYVGDGKSAEQQKQLVAKVKEMSQEQVVLDIIRDVQSGAVLPALPAPPPPAKQAAPPVVEDDDLGLGVSEADKAAAEAEAKAKADAAKKKAAATKKAKAEAEAKAKAEAEALAAQAAKPEVFDSSEVSDEDLINELGLDDL